MSYQPQFTITPALIARVEHIAALREEILAANVQVPWIPALQKDTRLRNAHSSTAIEGNPLTLEQVRLVLRPKQEQLLQMLRDHKTMAPQQVWDGIGVSKQGALDLLRPLLKAGLVKRVGTRKSGRYILG